MDGQVYGEVSDNYNILSVEEFPSDETGTENTMRGCTKYNRFLRITTTRIILGKLSKKSCGTS